MITATLPMTFTLARGRVHAVVRLRRPLERFKCDNLFFPQPPGTNNFAMVAGAMPTVLIVPMVLRPHGPAIFAFINPPAEGARQQHTPEGAPPIRVLILKRGMI